MTAVAFAAVTLAITFGCALIGTRIREKLPPEHVSKESQDVIRLGMGLVATMTALLLGLVTAAAKGSFDSTDTAVKNAAAGTLTLDRLLARYGPETKPSRDLLRRAVALRLETLWPETRGTTSGEPSAAPVDFDISPEQLQGTSLGEQVEDLILDLSPQNDRQRWLKGEALKLTEEVLKTRWRLLSSAGGSVSRAFLFVVIFWLGTTFGSFGLSAPRNGTVRTVLFISALSVAAAVFLILELDGAFDGLIKISSGPLQYALANLGR